MSLEEESCITAINASGSSSSSRGDLIRCRRRRWLPEIDKVIHKCNELFLILAFSSATRDVRRKQIIKKSSGSSERHRDEWRNTALINSFFATPRWSPNLNLRPVAGISALESSRAGFSLGRGKGNAGNNISERVSDSDDLLSNFLDVPLLPTHFFLFLEALQKLAKKS